MIDVIIGNVLSIFATASDSVSGTRKTPKGVLGVQIISQFFYAASSMVLRGYSAVVQNVVAVFRNLLAMSGKKRRWAEWILTAAAVVLGIFFNNRGALGFLPVVGNLEYTLAVFRFKNDGIKIKYAFVINIIMFAVFNFFIRNYVGAAMNIVVGVTTAVSLVKYYRDRKNGTEDAGDDVNKAND